MRKLALFSLLALPLAVFAQPTPAQPTPATNPNDQSALSQILRRLEAIDKRLDALEGKATIESRLAKIEEKLSAPSTPVAYAEPTAKADTVATFAKAVADELTKLLSASRPAAASPTDYPVVQAAGYPVERFTRGVGVPQLPPTMPGTPARSVVITSSSLPVAIPTAPTPTYAPATVRRGVTSSRGLLGFGILPKLFGGCFSGGGDPTPGTSLRASTAGTPYYTTGGT